MFYQCLKCSRRWEYPLAECPYCFVPLKEMPAKTVRVNSVSKITIPTLLHPIAPYYVLLLEDDFGNFWGYKSEIEYKAGDELKFNPNENAVAIWRVKYNVLEAIKKAIELIGGFDIDQNSKITILPTLSKASHSYFRDNTSPEFLASVLQLLLEKGAKPENIIVAGQNFDEIPAALIAKKSGLIDAGAKFKVNALDLSEGEFEKRDRFEIAKAVLNADLIINLAMEKNSQASAAKNLFCVLKKEIYLGQKYLLSEAEIIEKLETVLKNKVIVIGEAEYIQRSNKLTAFLGLVLAGKNSRNLDRVFNEITQSFKLPEIVKNINIEDISVVGRSVKEVQYQAEIF